MVSGTLCSDGWFITTHGWNCLYVELMGDLSLKKLWSVEEWGGMVNVKGEEDRRRDFRRVFHKVCVCDCDCVWLCACLSGCVCVCIQLVCVCALVFLTWITRWYIVSGSYLSHCQSRVQLHNHLSEQRGLISKVVGCIALPSSSMGATLMMIAAEGQLAVTLCLDRFHQLLVTCS